MTGKLHIECPASMQYHISKVIKGEYLIKYKSPTEKKVILDIGANVGAFCIWASAMWPDSVIYAYEPSKKNFDMLCQNISKNLAHQKVILNNVAVGDILKTKLYQGMHNCGEHSLYQVGEQQEEFERVETIDPSSLPKADILKIDTEGSEVDILEGLQTINYEVILLEYHWEADRRRIDDMLKSNYSLVGGHTRCLHRGVLKYLRNDLT